MSKASRVDTRLLLYLALAAFALGSSALLLYEHLRPTPTFCTLAGGCDLVRQSRWSKLLGIPTPLYGVVAFGGLLVLAFLPRLRRILRLASQVVALGAIGLIVLQAVEVKAWCVYCMFADLSAVALGVLSWLLARPPAAGQGREARGSSIVAVAAGVIAPFLFGLATRSPAAAQMEQPPAELIQPDDLPEPVAREQQPGVATLVEWLDFECPACRRQHELFERVLPQFGDRIRLVRKQLPLPGHQHAVPAARAYCCAEEKGEGEAMADLLMASEAPTKEACEAMASSLGIDLEWFRQCVDSERVTKRLERERQEGISVGVRALPTYYIGRERFEGNREEEAIRTSIERAITEAQGS
jgi:uncharacterized membrane protein/predicted DsbA family dithiol-disulfide isomerase